MIDVLMPHGKRKKGFFYNAFRSKKLQGFSLRDHVKLALMAKAHTMPVYSRSKMWPQEATVTKVDVESGVVVIGVGVELKPRKLKFFERRQFEGGTRSVHVSDLLYDKPKA